MTALNPKLRKLAEAMAKEYSDPDFIRFCDNERVSLHGAFATEKNKAFFTGALDPTMHQAIRLEERISLWNSFAGAFPYDAPMCREMARRAQADLDALLKGAE